MTSDFEPVLDEVPVAACVIAGNFAIQFANGAAGRLLGLSARELMGRDLRDFVSARARAQLEGACTVLRAPGEPTAIVDIDLARPSAASATVVRASISCAPNSSPGSRFLIVATDVTDLAPAAGIGQRDAPPRFVAVSRFAGGVAHDFNNLLQVILGRAAMLREFAADGHAALHLRELTNAGQRAQQLVQQLLSFGRQQRQEPERIEFDALVARVVEANSIRVSPSVELSLQLDAKDVEVVVDAAQFQKVVAQLIANADHAMKGKGRLVIRSGLTVRDEEMARDQPFVPPGVYACLSVTDDGDGIDASMLPYVFEPFFTTKGTSRAMGMGLAEAYGIIKQAGGYILIDSQPGKGTRVRVLLQPVAAEAESGAAGAPAAPGNRRRATVLVVDDEDAVRAIIVGVLRRDGLDVLEARSSAEAFLRCELHDGDVDALVTDLSLPDVSGVELSARLRRQYPRLQVLYVTGDSSEISASVPAANILDKPFAHEELRVKVRGLVERDANGADRDIE